MLCVCVCVCARAYVCLCVCRHHAHIFACLVSKLTYSLIPTPERSSHAFRPTLRFKIRSQGSYAKTNWNVISHRFVSPVSAAMGYIMPSFHWSSSELVVSTTGSRVEVASSILGLTKIFFFSLSLHFSFFLSFFLSYIFSPWADIMSLCVGVG